MNVANFKRNSSMEKYLCRKDFLNEIKFPGTMKIGDYDQNRSENIKKLQEWLNIWPPYHGRFNSVKMDGVFGLETSNSLAEVRKFLNMKQSELVNENMWSKIVESYERAFETFDCSGKDVRSVVIHYAKKFEMFRPYEISPNRGPWVRGFMGGRNGKIWAWCAGFVQTVLDMSFASLKKKHTDYLIYSLLCQDIRVDAKKRGILHTEKDILNGTFKPNPGDIFLLIKKTSEGGDRAFHIGIIDHFYKDSIDTIEGNTNLSGSADGVGVFRLNRKLSDNQFEFVSIDFKL